MNEADGLVQWKRCSEAGLVCGILGCQELKETLVKCKHGCRNHYCPEHQKVHFHVVDEKTGKVSPGPRVDGDKIVLA